MNIDRPGKVRSAAVLEPIIVGEPCVRRRHRHEVTRSRMVDACRTLRRLVEHRRHPVDRLEQPSHGRKLVTVSDVNMRHLVVRHRKHFARTEVHQLEPQLLFNAEPPALAKDPVQMNRFGHRHNPILGQQDDLDGPRIERVDEFAHNGVDPAQITAHPHMVWPESLQPVIQVRQVDQAQRRLMAAFNPLSSLCNPTRSRIGRSLTRVQSRRGPPKSEKRKLAEVRLDLRTNPMGPAVNIKDLPPVGRVHRAGRDRVIRGRPHVVPPKQFGAREVRLFPPHRVPEPRCLDQTLRLFPKVDFSQRPVIPAVADNAVLRRASPGHIVGLRRARHPRKRRSHARNRSGPGKLRNPGHLRPDEPPRQPHHIDHRHALHECQFRHVARDVVFIRNGI